MGNQKFFIASERRKVSTTAKLKKYDYFKNAQGKNEFFVDVAFCPYCNHMTDLYNFFLNKKGQQHIFTESEIIKLRYAKLAKNFKLKNEKYDCDATANFMRKCPKCGTDLSDTEVTYLTMNKNNESNYFLDSFSVVREKNKIKINAKIIRAIPLVWQKNIIKKSIYLKMIINTETGQTYAFEPRDSKNKRCAITNIPRISNVTWGIEGNGKFPEYRPLCSDNKVRQKIKEMLFEANPPQNNSFFRRRLGFDDLLLYNRFPQFDYNTIINIAKESYGYAPNNESIKKIKSNFSQEDILNSISIKLNSSAKKLIGTNYLKIFDVIFWTSNGFSDTNIIYNLLEHTDNVAIILKNEKMNLALLKQIISVKGESAAAKILEQTKNFSLLGDANRMYMSICKRGVTPDKSIYKKSIEYIHDKINDIYIELGCISSNETITYTDKEKELVQTIGDFSFRLPIDTMQLYIAGKRLHICVGTYSEKAISKKCTIVLMYQKEKLVGCIELSNRNLIQAKAVCNNLLQEYKAEALKIWVDNNNIVANDCYDYSHILSGNINYNENEIYQSTMRYDFF